MSTGPFSSSQTVSHNQRVLASVIYWFPLAPRTCFFIAKSHHHPSDHLLIHGHIRLGVALRWQIKFGRAITLVGEGYPQVCSLDIFTVSEISLVD